jgi:hypothetical protein
MNLAINTGFPDAAGDQLRILGTEIEDEYFLLHGVERQTLLSDSFKEKEERDVAWMDWRRKAQRAIVFHMQR